MLSLCTIDRLVRFPAFACLLSRNFSVPRYPFLIFLVVMNPEKHVRFTPERGEARARRSDLIKSFVWPALMDGGRCVFRAVVLT